MMCASTRASKSTSNPFVFGRVDASASRTRPTFGPYDDRALLHQSECRRVFYLCYTRCPYRLESTYARVPSIESVTYATRVARTDDRA